MSINDINNKIRDAVTRVMNSMITFYILNILIVVAVLIQPPKDLEGWLLVVISIWFQGVGLPALGASGKKDGDETRRILQETHDNVMNELTIENEERQKLIELVAYVHSKLEEQTQQMAIIQHILDELHKGNTQVIEHYQDYVIKSDS